MKYALITSALLATLGLSACDRPVVVNTPPATQTVSVPGPAGPPGVQGDKGNPGLQGDQGFQGNSGVKGDTGKTGDATNVYILPPASAPAN